MPYTQRRGNRPCTIPGLSIYCTTLARTQLVKSSTGSQGWDPLTKEICILDNVFFMFPYTAISWLLSFFFFVRSLEIRNWVQLHTIWKEKRGKIGTESVLRKEATYTTFKKKAPRGRCIRGSLCKKETMKSSFYWELRLLRTPSVHNKGSKKITRKIEKKNHEN